MGVMLRIPRLSLLLNYYANLPFGVAFAPLLALASLCGSPSQKSAKPKTPKQKFKKELPKAKKKGQKSKGIQAVQKPHRPCFFASFF